MTTVKNSGKFPPFQRGMIVETDISLTALDWAVAKWFERHGTYPSVVWIHPIDLGWIEKVMDAAPSDSLVLRLRPIPDANYDEDWWSVGSYTDRGFGSIGA